MKQADCPLNRHIGARLRLLRLQRGLSLDSVAEIIDVSQQQVSRYELGRNRLSAAQLYRLARGLDVPVAWFFRDYDEDHAELQRLRVALREDRGEWHTETPAEEEQALLLAWRALPGSLQRKRLIALIEAFSSSAEP